MSDGREAAQDAHAAQTGPGAKELLRLAIPNVLTNLTVPLASLVDLALLGHLDHIAPLAGVALSGVIFDYCYWSFGFLRMSTTGLIAAAMGARDLQRSAGIFFRSITLALLLGLLMIIAQSWIGDFGFSLLNGDEAVRQAGRAYFDARIWDAPAILAGMVLTGWLLGRQHVKATLLYALLLNGTNIILDWLFIYQFRMGAAGAGYATMIASYVALIGALLMVARYWRGHPRFSFHFLRQWDRFKALLRFQGHILLRTFCLITAFSLFTNLSAGFSTVVLAGNTVLLRFLSTAAYFIDGFSFSLEALAGRFAGAGDWPGVGRALRLTLRWNTAITLCWILALALFGKQLIGTLTSLPPVIAWAQTHLPYLCITLLFSSFAYIFDGYFLGLSRGALLMRSMLLATLGGFLPVAILAEVTGRSDYLWWAMLGFMILRAASLGWAAFRDRADNAVQIQA